ncbi:hypothetical protein AMECASPLE_036380 [Ameca splendens]|uniref:Uncharacterized protein n=1 Tax=Ameca splendens TaxID=208324 RepID=A0ABV0YIT0_9TELE
MKPSFENCVLNYKFVLMRREADITSSTSLRRSGPSGTPPSSSSPPPSSLLTHLLFLCSAAAASLAAPSPHSPRPRQWPSRCCALFSLFSSMIIIPLLPSSLSCVSVRRPESSAPLTWEYKAVVLPSRREVAAHRVKVGWMDGCLHACMQGGGLLSNLCMHGKMHVFFPLYPHCL